MREHWTLDPDLVYLNHGSFGAVPLVTQQAQQRLRVAAEANPMRWFRDLGPRLIATRASIGHYLGVEGGDIGLVPNATTGLNAALRSVGLGPDKRVVVTSHGYGAVRQAASTLTAGSGCRVVLVDVALDASDDDVVAALEPHLDDSAACVVIDQVTSATAKLMPAERITELGRQRGVPVIVDGAHAPALVDNPVCGDFWTGNLHKWPCAPRGTGILYVAPDRRAQLASPVVSWDEPLGFPLSLDYPGTTDATGWLAAPTALELMRTLGFAERRKELGDLVKDGAEVVADAIGGALVDVANPAPTMRLVALPEGVVHDEASAGRTGGFLARRTGVEVSWTSWAGRGFLRLSAHLYTSADDFVVAAQRLAPYFEDPSALAAAVLAETPVH